MSRLTEIREKQAKLVAADGQAEDRFGVDRVALLYAIGESAPQSLELPMAQRGANGTARSPIFVRPDPDVPAEALGARRVDVGQGSSVSWVVMADPEGNEFCILQPLGPEGQS